MKKLFLLLLVFIIMVFVTSCTKEQHVTSDNTATLNVINGVINKSALIKMNGSINNSGMSSSGGNQNRISFGSNLFFFSQPKNADVAVLNSTDSSVLVTKNIDFKKGGIYTMLLAGIAPSAEVVVIDDSNIPMVNQSVTPTDADSVVYVRFINLSPDVQPIDVHMQGAATNEVSGLSYKNYTAFKAYPGKITTYFGTLGVSLLPFEIKQNGIVLKTVTLFVFSPGTRFRNVALVLTGMKNPGPGQPALNIAQVNYFQ